MSAKAEIQKLADLCHAREHWRVHDVYPHDRWRRAEHAVLDQLQTIMLLAKNTPPSPSISALTALE